MHRIYSYYTYICNLCFVNVFYWILFCTAIRQAFNTTNRTSHKGGFTNLLFRYFRVFNIFGAQRT